MYHPYWYRNYRHRSHKKKIFSINNMTKTTKKKTSTLTLPSGTFHGKGKRYTINPNITKGKRIVLRLSPTKRPRSRDPDLPLDSHKLGRIKLSPGMKKRMNKEGYLTEIIPQNIFDSPKSQSPKKYGRKSSTSKFGSRRSSSRRSRSRRSRRHRSRRHRRSYRKK